MQKTVFINAKTIAVAAAGGALLELTGAPAAWLSGALAACAVFAVAGSARSGGGSGGSAWGVMHISTPLRNAAFLTIGVVIGSSVDADTLSLLPRWPVSLAALAITLAALMTIAPWYFMRVHKLDRGTAKLSAVPGALSVIVAMSEHLPVDQRRIAVLQSLRVAVLMFAVPLAAGAGLEIDSGAAWGAGGGAGGRGGPLLTWADAALLFGCALAAAPLAQRINFPAPFLTGPMLAAAALFGSGAVAGQLPGPAVIAAYVVLGAVVGARFTGVDGRYLAACAAPGLGGVALSVGITCLAAWPAAAYMDLPFIQMWLAFAPGGFEAMTALALALDVDPVFVAGHQFARLMALFLLAPWLFRNAGRENGGRGKR